MPDNGLSSWNSVPRRGQGFFF